MNNGQLTKTDRQVARPLSVISGLIKREREAADADSSKHWQVVAGLLAEAFYLHFHESWTDFQIWFDGEDFDFGFRSAREKVLSLGKIHKVAAAKQISQRTARAPSGYQMPDEEIRDKVRKSIEMSRRILAEAAVKKDESDAIRKLALQIVDIGYRTLSAKLHPDRRGGSHDAMRRLSAARQLLKGYLG